LAYSKSFQAGFALDNKTLLLDDPRLREATVQNLGLIFGHTYWWPNGESGLYRPVTTLSYLLNYAVLDNAGRPAGYHWINLVLHLGNVLLVYGVLVALIGRFGPAFWGAALWAVHPVHTEAVTNIIGRSDLLASASVLSGLLLYRKIRGSAPGWRRAALLAALAAVTTVGVFSKESAVVLLGIVLLYEVVDRLQSAPASPVSRLVAPILAILLPIAFMLLLRARILAASGKAEFPYWDNPLTAAGFWTGRLTALKVLALYLWRAVWPFQLSGDYSYAQIPLARGTLADWISWAVIGAALAGVVFLYRRNRQAFFFATFAAVALLPVSNLVFPIGTIMAERFLYLPMVGLAAVAVLALSAASHRAPTLAIPLLCLVVAAFALRTWERNRDWRDDLAIAESAVRTSPASFKTHYLLSRALYAADPGHTQLDRIIAEADRSLAILATIPDNLNYATPYRWAGECYLLKGDMTQSAPAYSRAVQALRKCLAIPQDQAGQSAAYHALSTAWLRLGNPQAALDAAGHALGLDPLNPASYTEVAVALAAAGRSDDAAERLMQGVFLTNDAGLWQRLLGLYRSGLDRIGCATRPGPRGEALNPDCAIVRRHFCAAESPSIQTAVAAGRPDLARNLKAAGAEQFGCAPPN
jgi:tetratricopeptide (TPR) repeat protein